MKSQRYVPWQSSLSNITICAIAFLFFSGCEVKHGDKLTVVSKGSNFATHCVGRLSIEIPADYKMVDGTFGLFKFQGLADEELAIAIVVSESGMDQPKFNAEVARRRAVLRASADDTTDILSFERTMAPEAVLFRVNRIDDAFVSEINFFRGQALITATVKSWDRKFLAAEALLERFVEGVQSSGESRPDAFCLGPVKISGSFSEETGNYLFIDSKRRGNSLSLDVDTSGKGENTSLLQRMSGRESLLAKFGSDHKVMRAGKTSFASLSGEEWLGSIKSGEPEYPKKLQFVWESTRSASSKEAPYLHLAFNTGRTLEDGSVDKTVMSDEQALRQWDGIVSSIKPLKP